MRENALEFNNLHEYYHLNSVLFLHLKVRRCG